jgi:nicotinate-nucleotide pyrophosphorylase (carboxylating)
MHKEIELQVKFALEEDIGSGDITGHLIPKELLGRAKLYAREAAVVCGQEWFVEVFKQISTEIKIKWLVQEGGYQETPGVWAECEGPLSAMLTGERTALNFLQTLSAVATKTFHYANFLKGSKTKLLDTRKTIPGLRNAQKYAVRCGGGYNHRFGLYDEFLIKENHIESLGGIEHAIMCAKRSNLNKPIVVEVQTIDEFLKAKALKVTRIMLDNFDDEAIAKAIKLNQDEPCPIEVSGGIDEMRLKKLAGMGVDYISVGGLTKSVAAIDLSFLVIKK